MPARPITLVLLTLILAILISACGDDGLSKGDHLATAIELQAAGQLEEAILWYDQAIDLDLKYGEAYTNRGNVYLELGRPQLAITDSTKAMEIDSGNAMAYANRAEPTPEFPAGRSAFGPEQGHQAEPRYPGYSNRASVYALSGRY